MCYEIQNISNLPGLDELRRKSQALALLDAIIMPTWENRYFSFNCNWEPIKNEMMASMRDGSGNEYFLHFSKAGLIGKVFYQEDQKNTNLLLSSIPDVFSAFKNEPAFSLNNTSYIFWKTYHDNTWSTIPNKIGKYSLLGFLAGDGYYYHKWAENYYDKKINEIEVNKVFDSLHFDKNSLELLNSELSMEELDNDIKEILG